MPSSENSTAGHSQLELELYFLIARFLDFGPCQEAAKVLKREIEANKLLPKRTDWQGQEHFRSFENLVNSNRHIAPSHLLQVCQRIGPLLDKDIPPSVMGVMSLLGAGRQSVLRTWEDVKHSHWNSSVHVACHHGRPLMPPRNLAHPPVIPMVLCARETSGVMRRDHARPSKGFYTNLKQLARSLGHLSAVYCLCFDRRGECIITGADDALVKIWSAMSGRLLATLRGHSAEITDMTVNYENTLLATGSCDKYIRVWSLQRTSPVAVLHGHSGSITMIQFCPLVRGDTRYLASTGADGCVCFWEWNVRSHKFNPKPTKFVERSRAGTQMLCSSFSPGGTFLATGSSDHVVRVYCLAGYSPEKISELESHTDNVDSIQYSHSSSRFLTGSKDGSARIWRYDRQQWKSIHINVAQTLPCEANPAVEDGKPQKHRVTMVCWTQDDNHVLTAVNDFSIKIWDSHTGQLVQVLRGHEDEVYVLESNPTDARMLLSAGHDGHIMVWDITTATIIKNHFNLIQGQGHGAVFDCKWAPDGLSFSAVDSHGFLMYFGFGCADRYKRLPDHQFFHTDYRPLIRDANNYVLDEQTQQPPHLMAPGFLVDMDGNPYPPRVQRLVPGRENSDDAFLIPMVGVTPSGDREVLDEAIAEAPQEVQQQQQQGAQGEDGDRAIIDHLIERMQREQDERIVAAGGEPLLSPNRDGPLSPPAWGPRRSMDTDPTHRLSTGSDHDEGPGTSRQQAGDPGEGSSQSAAASQGTSPPGARRPISMSYWAKHKCVHKTDYWTLKNSERTRLQMAEVELKMYISEKKKKPLPPSGTDSSTDSGSQPHVKTRKRKKMRSRSTRSNIQEETTVNRLVTRALYDTEEEEEETPETEEQDMELEDTEMWHSNASDSGESSDYSDWTADTGVNLQPPKRTSARVPKKKRFHSEDEETEEEALVADDEDVAIEDRTSRTRKKKPPPPRKQKKETKRQRRQRQVMNQQERSPIRELPEQFRPPDWLSDTIPRRAPYVPQMGDEVVYFRQGHELYVQAVKKREVYDINPNKNQPWHKLSLRDTEVVKVVGIKYEIRPPRLVCLKLAFIDPETSKLTGGSFTIKYHDMPDVIDFLVLRQDFDTAMKRNWKIGSHFRCMIDDAWWTGKVASQEPLQEEYQDSMFQCLNVHWDNGEREKMSPWDLEPIDKKRLPSEPGGSVLVTPEEVKAMLYTPKPVEWPGGSRDRECDRIVHCLEQIMELAIAEPFLVPVDLNAFPVYAMVIAYPVDLSTIKGRLENRYYRRVSSLQYDVRYIEANATTFNEANSHIVKYAKLVSELTLRIIGDPECTDPMPVYSELTKDVNFAIVPITGRKRASNRDNENTDDDDDDDDDDEGDAGEGTSSGKKRRLLTKRRSSRSATVDPNAWKDSCQELISEMMENEDSEPFREPVNIELYPDYYQVIDHPIDLGAIKEQLDRQEYSDPSTFAKDVRLMFNNSRSYNTNKRSRIYTMTLRLSFMFEDHIRHILQDWSNTKKAQRKSNKRSPPDLRRRKTRKRLRELSSSSGSPGAAGLQVSPTQPSTSAGVSRPTSLLRAAGTTRSRALEVGSRGVGPSRATTSNSRGDRSSQRVAQRAAVGSTSSRSRREERTCRTASKRKRLESSPDEHTDVTSSSSSAEESKSDSDYNEDRKLRSRRGKKQPPRKSKAKKVMNGHAQRYSTRCATGKIKRRRYGSIDDRSGDDNDDDDDDEEEGEQTVPQNRKEKDSSSSSDTSLRSSEAASDTEASDSDQEKAKSSSGSDTEEYSESEAKQSRQHNTRRGSRSAASSQASRQGRSLAMVQASREGSTLQRDSSQVRTRNQGRRTVRYEEHVASDESMQNSDSDTDSEPVVTVSSRGRIRKLTPRARALVGD